MILEAVAILLCIAAGLWIYGRWNFGTLEKMGLPVVEYTNPLLGSTREIYMNPGGPQDVKWMRKYGQVFGVYEGRTPQIMVCNPDLIRLICVKDAHYFDERRHFDFRDPLVNEFPDFLPYDRWKVVRSLYTSTLTSSKVSLMHPPIKEATQDFVAELQRKIKEGNGVHEKIAINQALSLMVTDLVARTFFSLKLENPYDSNNEFAKIAAGLGYQPPSKFHFELTLYTHVFPFLRHLLAGFVFDPKPMNRFKEIFKQMLDARRKSGLKRNDLVDACLEWFERLDTPEFKKAGVTENTLYFQALVFMVSAQDQVAIMVAGVIYHMTQDPELEAKVYAEIDAAFEKGNGSVGHDQLTELVTSQACISECLRLYTLFHRGERVCVQDWKNEEHNLSIKKGTVIQVPVWALNRNGEYNKNPDDFDYTRFMPENKHKVNVYSMTSHGHGPRQCVGRPFVQQAMPLVLAYVLRDLKFRARKDTQVTPVPGGFFFQPHAEIFVDVMNRRDS